MKMKKIMIGIIKTTETLKTGETSPVFFILRINYILLIKKKVECMNLMLKMGS